MGGRTKSQPISYDRTSPADINNTSAKTTKNIALVTATDSIATIAPSTAEKLKLLTLLQIGFSTASLILCH